MSLAAHFPFLASSDGRRIAALAGLADAEAIAATNTGSPLLRVIINWGGKVRPSASFVSPLSFFFVH